ncbi:glycine oxidase ThiO [Neobacillus mesonae]|uniref:glycine oxidase ThiO n=1 Tax=Neobacillus mesonae TaxID=1193713 RepID=UPI00203FEF1F|nr:glycine oxidase ThiO [Neobacillus mesonae]MCM3571108.1 glycine oxidase ThiO [Neobacillus mesonae]
MGKFYDVAVIGGGIIGNSIAYYLAKEKVSTAVFESGQMGGKTTSAAAGMLGAHSECDDLEVFYPFARKSQQSYAILEQELRDLTGIDIRKTAGGIYKLAFNENEKQELLPLCSLQTVEWQDARFIRQAEPAITSEILGAAYIEEDVHVLPKAVCQSFCQGAQIYGADLYEFTHVYDIQKNGGIFNVKTQAGDFEAKHIVVASGVWSNTFFHQLGLANRIIPVKGECLSVWKEGIQLQHTLFHEHCYIVPRSDGTLVIGATMVENNWSEKPTIGGLAQMIAKAKSLLPAIERMKVASIWAGLRPQTFDGRPFIGHHPEDDQILFAAGHFRNGILLAPATGQMIKDFILQRKVDEGLAEAFRINRKSHVLV